MQIFTIFILFLFLSIDLQAVENFTIDKITLEKAEKDYGKDAKQKLLDLVLLLNILETKTEDEKLRHINNFFNKIEYDTDMNIWNKKDYWTSRDEFLGTSIGDCEDYVIAKYFSLRQLGISEQKIYLTYVKAIKYKQSHMVLTYFKTKDSVPLILDNINQTILPATQRKDLRPLFNFNGEKIYMAKQRGLGRVIPQGKVNLKQWTNLILKIKRERL